MKTKFRILNNIRKSQIAAATRMVNALKEAFPEGSEVKCYLSSRQAIPSSGVVVYHHSDGTLRVRLKTGTVKNVNYSMVVT
jgi:hypothetical protein